MANLRTPVGGLSPVIDGGTSARPECNAEGRRPKTDEEGEVKRSADAVRERSSGCSRTGIDKGPRILAVRVGQQQRFLSQGECPPLRVSGSRR